MSGSKWNHTFSEGPNLIDGQWHTIALTYNGAGRLSLYIDYAFEDLKDIAFHNFALHHRVSVDVLSIYLSST
jgi:hypothetical protein